MRPLRKNAANPHKNTPKRSQAQMDADAVFIEKYLLEGYTLREVAQRIAETRPYTLSQQMISLVHQKLKAQWRDEAMASIDERVAKMLKRFDKRRKELEKAWRRSQKDFESRIERQDADGENSYELRVEQRDGQVAFQNALSDLDRQEAELMGMNKPRKTALTDVEGKESFQPLVINVSSENLPRAKKDNKE